MNARQWSNEEDRLLLSMSRLGLVQRAIAAALERPKTSIHSRLMTLSLKGITVANFEQTLPAERAQPEQPARSNAEIVAAARAARLSRGNLDFCGIGHDTDPSDFARAAAPWEFLPAPGLWPALRPSPSRPGLTGPDGRVRRL